MDGQQQAADTRGLLPSFISPTLLSSGQKLLQMGLIKNHSFVSKWLLVVYIRVGTELKSSRVFAPSQFISCTSHSMCSWQIDSRMSVSDFDLRLIFFEASRVQARHACTAPHINKWEVLGRGCTQSYQFTFP